MNRVEFVQKHYTEYQKAYLDTHGECIQDAQLGIMGHMLSWIGELLQLRGVDKLLDCGSGFGYPAAYFAKTFKSTVLGLNIVPSQLEYSKKFESKNCAFMNCNFEQLDLVDYKPTKICFLESFGYAEDPMALLKKCSDVLPEGGMVLIKSFCPKTDNQGEFFGAATEFYGYDFHPLHKIIEWAFEAGLHTVSVSQLPAPRIAPPGRDFLKAIGSTNKVLTDPRSQVDNCFVLVLKKESFK